MHDVARAAGTEHHDIVLDSQALADPDVRARVIRARDLPMGFGDMDASLYLLFKAIREHSTVALSGESADEVFGGYLQFFDEEARAADTFPWLVQFAEHFGDDADVLRPDLTDALDLPGYIRHSYAVATAGIHRLDGESDFEYRMRRICHLHLTRFVRVLLDRKDRTSMAVGLEVRVPFCDHRLVEYVYNTPWSLKSFDGREKSLLREATARCAAAVGVRPGEEPVSVDAGSEVRGRPAGAGQGSAGPPLSPGLRTRGPGPAEAGRAP